MTSEQLLKIVEQYSQNNETNFGEVKVIRIPDQKTVFVEPFSDGGRTVMMAACQVADATYWAGYSSRSQTVYLSLAA